MQRTTWIAGLCLLVAGALELVVALRVVIPVTETVLVPVGGPLLAVPAALLQGVGLVLLAVGLRGEPGAAGGSRIGRVALIVFAMQEPFGALSDLVPVTSPTTALLIVSTATRFVFVAAGVTAALLVARAGTLHGAARWSLLPLAVVSPLLGNLIFLLAVMQQAPVAQAVAGAILLAPLELLPALLLVAFAASLLLHGRTAAARERLTAIRAAW